MREALGLTLVEVNGVPVRTLIDVGAILDAVQSTERFPSVTLLLRNPPPPELAGQQGAQLLPAEQRAAEPAGVGPSAGPSDAKAARRALLEQMKREEEMRAALERDDRQESGPSVADATGEADDAVDRRAQW